MSNTTQFEGTTSKSKANANANANAIRALDVLLSDMTSLPTTPPRRKQNHPAKRDSQARSPYIPSSHLENYSRREYQHNIFSAYDDNDNNNDESDSDDAALNSFSSSKEFAALLQSHVQKQQLLRRQRLQRQHEKQQQRLRDYTEYQQQLSRDNWKLALENDHDDNTTEPEEDYIPVQSAELPNPFLSTPDDLCETRQRRPFKTKSRTEQITIPSTSTSSTSTKSTISTVPTSSSTTATDVAKSFPDPASGYTASNSEATSTSTNVIPKRQYKKTILRQQAALLAAQIKDENEARDQEATRRVFARSDVIKHLRTLKSRLAYAHYKVDQGLEEQPLHIVAEIFEDYTGDSGAGEDHLRDTSPRLTKPSHPKTSDLSRKHQHNTNMKSLSKYSSSHQSNRTPEGDDERNDESEESNDSQSSVAEIELWKTPTKPNRSGQTFIYSEDSDSDDLINKNKTPSKITSSSADRNCDAYSIPLTQEDLLLQQQAQLEDLQRKQREQLRELKRMQKEQQLALWRTQKQPNVHQSSTFDEKNISPAKSLGVSKPSGNHLNAKKEKAGIPNKNDTPYVKSENFDDVVSPYISPVKHHSPLKSRTLSLHHKNNLASPPPTPPRLNHSKPIDNSLRIIRSSSDARVENQEQRSQVRRQPLGERSENVNIKPSQSDAQTLQLKQQEQDEHRQRQQQKLQQNRQKEKELAQKQRVLEQQQQKKKQLLLQLHQTHDFLSRDSSPSRQRNLPSTPSRMKPIPGAAVIQTTPKKKKPLNPVQKAPSTENILASARSNPIVRSAMIATSPALAVAKNVLLGNKRGQHAAFEDKENIGAISLSPRSNEMCLAKMTLPSSHSRTITSPKVYKRQKPETKVSEAPTLSVLGSSTTLPITFTETDPISLSAVASSAFSSSPLTLPKSISTTLDISPSIQSISSPDPGSLSQYDGAEASLQSSKDFLECFEQWVPETLTLDVGEKSDSIALTSLTTLPEVNESEPQSLGFNDDPNLQDGDFDQGEETELDETEIDRLLYSEIGEDYSSFGGQLCESAPSSEIGLQELTSDTGPVDLYDWFSDAAQDYVSFNPNDQKLSLLSMAPTGLSSSSPADLTESLDLALEYDSTADLFWAHQEQQLQNLQIQQQLSTGETYEHTPHRSGTPQLDSTASTLLSSSYSDIVPISVTRNHSNQYIPMGFDGGLIISNLQDKNEHQDEVEHSPASDFATPTDNNNTEYGIWNI